MEQLNINIDSLRSMHRFGDCLEEAIKKIESKTCDFEIKRDTKDCIGRHWYGLRVNVTDKNIGTGFYLHIGLIYYPTTRKGLMVELDEQNNQNVYSAVTENIKLRDEFEVSYEEKEYFKLFMPDKVFGEMLTKQKSEQINYLKEFVQNAAEAIVEADSNEGFYFTIKNLDNSRNLINAFDKALNKVDSKYSKVKINYDDKDNFGQYASGFRYYLSDYDEKETYYAYFGAIYSYKKDPAGIFAEIDWFSNQSNFDKVYKNLKVSNKFNYSNKEPKFIKLFMKEEDIEKFNKSSYDEQIEQLKEFLKDCNDAMVLAGLKG